MGSGRAPRAFDNIDAWASMRIWDIPVWRLCRAHLLGEHRKLHGLWSILVNGKKGYSRHPETLRWQGRLRALWNRHEAEVREMERRGYRHASPLRGKRSGPDANRRCLATPQEQRALLKAKGCACKV